MEIVRCDMCFDLHQLDDVPNGYIFICIKCAEILSKIRKQEIKNGVNYTNFVKMIIFKKLRGL